MHEKFINKTIYFFGDSNTARGGYVSKLRSFLFAQKQKCYVFNRGTSGARATMAEHAIADEISDYKPDFVVINFAINDMGIWLYDKFVPLTQQLLDERKSRDDASLNAVKRIIDFLFSKNVTPIIMGPFACNQLLAEREGIKTIADNAEKEVIGDWFYKRETFRNINEGLLGYSERLKKLAIEKNVDFIDAFTPTKNDMMNIGGMFLDDGIHYSNLGAETIARCILSYFGFTAPTSFNEYSDNQKLLELENLDRALAFHRYNVYNPIFSDLIDEEIFNVSMQKANDETLSEGERNVNRRYVENVKNKFNIRNEIRKLTVI